jgi:hypothetical protein
MAIYHAKSITVADATGTITFWNGTTTGSLAATDAQRPSDWNSAHNVNYVFGGTTTGASTVSGTDVPFYASGNISIGGSNGSVLFSVPIPKLYEWRNIPPGNNTSFSSLGQNTIYLQQFTPEVQLEFSSIKVRGRGSFVSSSNSMAYSETIRYGIYQQPNGANSTQWTLLGSSSIILLASFNSNTAAGFTISQGAGSFTTTSGGTAFMANFSGPFEQLLPFTTTLSADGDYAIAVHISSTTAVGTQAWRHAMLVNTNMNSLSFARLYESTFSGSATNIFNEEECVVYSATSAGLPATLPRTALSVNVSRQVLPFKLLQ